MTQIKEIPATRARFKGPRKESRTPWKTRWCFWAATDTAVPAMTRSGHIRSSQPCGGNEMDTYADELATLVEALGLKYAHPCRALHGGEVSRYSGRHGTQRVAKAVPIASVTPLMLRTAGNPGGLLIDAFDKDPRQRSCRPLSIFQGSRRRHVLRLQQAGHRGLTGLINSFWLQRMQAGGQRIPDCVKAFSGDGFCRRPQPVRHADAQHPWRRRRPDRPDGRRESQQDGRPPWYLALR